MLVFQKNNEKEPYAGPPRVGFTFTYSHHLNSSILFGGDKNSDVWLYDHTKRIWTIKSTLNSKKSPKVYQWHAAVVVEELGGLVISGGRDLVGHSLDDIFLLGFRDWKWRKILLPKSPIARQKHALLNLTRGQLLLFGGVSMPYNDITNDCWLLSYKAESKHESLSNQIHNIGSLELKTKGTPPEGICHGDGVILIGDRLFCASKSRKNPGEVLLYVLDLVKKSWKKEDIKFVATELRFYKMVSEVREETVVISTSSDPGRQEPKFFWFNHREGRTQPMEIGWGIGGYDNIAIDSDGLSQTICVSKGKNIQTFDFTFEEWQGDSSQPKGSIEDYLIAIKHEQLLSQELSKKNVLLEELYKEMQNYITSLNHEYVSYQCDLAVQSQKAKHIDDCKTLKIEYTRLNKAHQDVVGTIHKLRADLSAINQDFQRCIQTQFDDQA